MCPYRESTEHKLPVHPMTDESHYLGWQSNTGKLSAFTAWRTEWKVRNVKEWRAENICSSEGLIFKSSASHIWGSSRKSCIPRCMFQPGGMGSINPVNTKLLRTGRRNSFSSCNLLIDKVHDCSQFIFLTHLTRITATRSYKIPQQL